MNKYINTLKSKTIPITVNDSWYYHDFRGDLETLASILEKGILCKKDLGIRKSKSNGYNGMYYISVTKYNED